MVLLVIDTQKGITDDRLYEFDKLKANIKELIALARDNNKEVIQESPEENNVQLEDHPDNFSDHEEDDDFYKIQVENFKNKTAKDFHKNVIIIDEKAEKYILLNFHQFIPGISKTKNQKRNLKRIKPKNRRLIQLKKELY